jgi:hypothetical protein
MVRNPPENSEGDASPLPSIADPEIVLNKSGISTDVYFNRNMED